MRVLVTSFLILELQLRFNFSLIVVPFSISKWWAWAGAFIFLGSTCGELTIP